MSQPGGNGVSKEQHARRSKVKPANTSYCHNRTFKKKKEWVSHQALGVTLVESLQLGHSMGKPQTWNNDGHWLPLT